MIGQWKGKVGLETLEGKTCREERRGEAKVDQYFRAGQKKLQVARGLIDGE